MKRTIPILLDTLHFLALAFWLGGLVTLWLALMPAAFHTSGLTLRQAETVVGETLRHFTPLVEICGLTMIGAQFLLRRRYQRDRTLFLADGVRQLLTFGALLGAEFCLRSLLPQMDAARQQVHVREFSQLHQSYAVLATVQAITLIGIGIVTAWLQSPLSIVRAEGKSAQEQKLSSSTPTATTQLSKVVANPRRPMRKTGK